MSSVLPYSLSFCYDSGFQPSVLSSAWMWMRYQSPHLPDRLEDDIIFLLRSQSEASTWSPAFGGALCTQERRAEGEAEREGHRDTKTDRQTDSGWWEEGGMADKKKYIKFKKRWNGKKPTQYLRKDSN